MILSENTRTVVRQAIPAGDCHAPGIILIFWKDLENLLLH